MINRKNLRLILVVVAILLVLIKIFFKNNDVGKAQFSRENVRIKYSAHARCRMECRQITAQEVMDVLKTGKINYDKSDLQASQCPRYAIEAKTDDGQQVRIIFAQCSDKTVVVTAIDLNHEYKCNCK